MKLRLETDSAFGLRLAGGVFGDELLDGIEDDGELLVVFALDGLDLFGEIAIGIHEPAELDEGAHDGDVHLDGPLGTKDAGEHGDALLGEGVGEEFPVLATL
jgi:hypothetical protein